jgi:acetylornithine deacetylase
MIGFRSLSGREDGIVSFLHSEFERRTWNPQLLPVEGTRSNLFVQFGVPKIVFTTHVDVVPGPEGLFSPRFEEDRLYGRGAVDAKGIAATMVVVCEQLLKSGATDFGLLLVVGEELDGIGARAAARALLGRGIRYIINGEPTEGAAARAHKGGLGFKATYNGKASHSGYPEAGLDANQLAIEGATRLLGADYGEDPVLGPATLSLGRISGGVAGNIISPEATIEGLVRTVTPHSAVIQTIKEAASPGTVEVTYDVPPMSLLEIPGLPSAVVAYCCDIQFFAPLGAEAVLYGPGSILRAHTDTEFISRSEIEGALSGYRHIFETLRARL